jgi:60 kDa SS-A/Ro ribonucleoprotein
VPVEILTELEHTREHWTSIAAAMTWTQTSMNLGTLLRRGVLDDQGVVNLVAERLGRPAAIRRARALPYQVLLALRQAGPEMPDAIRRGLHAALAIATENIPPVPGKVYVCPDVSRSMHAPVAEGHADGASGVRCIDVAGLVAASLRRHSNAEVIAFSDDVVRAARPFDAQAPALASAEYLASSGGGNTCSTPLRFLNERRAAGDLVVYVSDDESWPEFARVGERQRTRATVMSEEWDLFRARNPQARLVLIDLRPRGAAPAAPRDDVLHVGGFSDTVFAIMSLFAKGELAAAPFVRAIESVTLS